MFTGEKYWYGGHTATVLFVAGDNVFVEYYTELDGRFGCVMRQVPGHLLVPQGAPLTPQQEAVRDAVIRGRPQEATPERRAR